MRLVQSNISGENRVALLNDHEQIKSIYIQRESMLNLDEVLPAIITQKAPPLNGYFAKTAKNLPIFIPSKEHYAEGQRVNVMVTKEARMGKDANGVVTSLASHPIIDIAQTLSQTLGLIIQENWGEYDLDDKIADLLTPSVPFAKGASLHIERTHALWTIDVDTGNSPFQTVEINKIAVDVIVSQIQLRGLSGLILIDFAGAKYKNEQGFLHEKISYQLSKDNRSQVLYFTAGKLLEIKRARTYASLADLMLNEKGQLSAQTTAYIIMRAIFKSKAIIPTLIAHPNVINLLHEKLKGRVKFEPNLNISPDFFEIKE